MSRVPSTARRRAVAGAAFMLAAVTGLGVATSSTLAARQTEEHVRTQFDVMLPHVFSLEGSTDGSEWTQGPSPIATLDFNADQRALEPGESNAVFAPMWVRVGEGSTSGGTSTVSASISSSHAFADSLRTRVYAGGTRCDVDPDGVQIQFGALRDSTTSEFDLAAPADGTAGEPTLVCVKAWMNDNDWLLSGGFRPTVTATWTVDGQTA